MSDTKPSRERREPSGPDAFLVALLLAAVAVGLLAWRYPAAAVPVTVSVMIFTMLIAMDRRRRP